MTLPAALLLLSSCSFLEEQRTAPTAVAWSGYIYSDLPTEDTALLEVGSLTAVDLDDTELSTGGTYEDSPGYWQIEVPVDTDLALRLTGGDQYPTVWRGHSPSGRGYWLNGALFAMHRDTVDGLLDGLRGFQDLDPADLADEEVAHLWAQPTDREAFAGVDVAVLDELGEAQVVRLAVDTDGALVDAGTGPVDLILAVDLLPGPVTLVLTGPDGASSETTWPARGGDLLAGFFLSAP